MQFKRFLRICSAVLILALLINLFPLQAFALDNMDADDNATLIPSAPSGPVEVVEEVIGKRTEYSKEFLLSNGLHMAAVYGEPVHFQKNGNWENIDNTLKLTTSGFTNTAGPWAVTLPQQLGGKPLGKSVNGQKVGQGLILAPFLALGGEHFIAFFVFARFLHLAPEAEGGAEQEAVLEVILIEERDLARAALVIGAEF